MIIVSGLPLFSSSGTKFWSVIGMKKGKLTPFPIRVWCGVGKPICPNTYLRAFVDEAKRVGEDGVLYYGLYSSLSTSLSAHVLLPPTPS